MDVIHGTKYTWTVAFMAIQLTEAEQASNEINIIAF